MPEVRLGFPCYDPVAGVVYVPRRSMSDVMDVGASTAHEIAHFRMGHRVVPVSGKYNLQKEVEAWVWAVSRRGVTKADKEYFKEEVMQHAEDERVSKEDLAILLRRAEKKVLRLRRTGRA